LRGSSTFTDFFLICSGTSEPHLKAIVSELKERLWKEYQIKPLTVDGSPQSQWIVAHFGEVVIHIFHEEKRAYYGLEDLWGDAPRLTLKAA
jgi:ribosome-associated protein